MSKIKLLGIAPSINDAVVETEDYSLQLTELEGELTGYSLVNKHTNVIEDVQRVYAQAVKNLQTLQDSLRPQAAATPKVVKLQTKH